MNRISSLLPVVTVRSLVALGLAANLAIAPAASPAIGVAIARGAFELDASKVAGNATLFDGSTVETGKAESELRLQNGVNVVLESGTRSRIYRDRLLLEKGTGQITAGSNYRIQARSLQVEGVSAESSAKVSLANDRVLVAAVRGPVQVRSAAGVLLANVGAGFAVELSNPSTGSSETTVSGRLEKRDGRYLLTDCTAGVTFEVKGNGLEQLVGSNVEVTGIVQASAKPAAPAEQLVQVQKVKKTRKSQDCAAPVVSGAGAGTGAGTAGTAGAAAGIGTKAIVAGVVVAGAAVGSTVALTHKNKDKDKENNGNGDDKKNMSK